LPRVKVRLYTILQEVADRKEVEIEASSVKEVVSTLVNMFGDDFKARLINEKTGSIKPFFNILVDGKRLFLPKEMNSKLHEGNVVDIFPPVGGGC